MAARRALAIAKPFSVHLEYLSSIPRGAHTIETYMASSGPGDLQAAIRICKTDGRWGAHAHTLDPTNFPRVDPGFLTALTTGMFPHGIMWRITSLRRSTVPSCRERFLVEPFLVNSQEEHGLPIACEHPHLAMAARYIAVLSPAQAHGRPSAPPHPSLGGDAHPPDTEEWRRLVDELAKGDPSFAFIVGPLTTVANFIEARRVAAATGAQPAVGQVPMMRPPEATVSRTQRSASSARLAADWAARA